MTIKEARIKAELTQKETADLLGISKRAIEEWEAGTRHPKAGEAYWTERILALGILAKDGRESLLEGEIDMDTVLMQYKIRKVEELSKWGNMQATFNANWQRIPHNIRLKLSAEELAELVDTIKTAYDDGYQK